MTRRYVPSEGADPLLLDVPAVPAPPGAEAGVLRAADGTRLRFAAWRPAGPLRGTVLVLPGRAEFIEKYFEVIGELLARGFAVAALDWRGQGGSERPLRDPRKGHVNGFDRYRRDLDALLAGPAADLPRPLFALAHSMGALVLLGALAAGERRVARAVLTAPLVRLAGFPGTPGARRLALGLAASGFARAYVPGGGGVSPAAKPFAGNRLTSDPARHARGGALLAAAPHLAVGDPTVGWLASAYRAMGRLEERATRRLIRAPLLVVAPGADPLCDPAAMLALARALPAATGLDLPGARHEALMERDALRALFWAAFDAFVPGEVAREPLAGERDASPNPLPANL